MALPSAKRPKEVEKDFLQRLESLKREKELLESSNTNKPEIFQNVMSDWFKALPKSRQARVTPKELKLKALRVCQSWEVVYERLPLDWVQRLQSECNMKLYVKRKKPLASKKMKQDKLKLRNETNSAEALDDPASQRGRGSDANQRACKKKFVDLSSSPPPPFWLTAYAQGVVFPRILTVYSADDVNLIYYDYAPQLRDCFERDVKFVPQPRTTSSLNQNGINEVKL